MATRPTSDRVREALFSMLASDGLPGNAERILDLYAGSGALAFESLSRGAATAVLVEHARDAVSAIRDNVRALGADDRVHVLATRVDRALERLEGPFDVVFADPPYADVRAAGFAELAQKAASLVGPGGIFVLEHASGDEPPAITGLIRDRSRRYGDTTLTFWRAESGAGEE